MKYIYPAVFRNAEEGGYIVNFPDFGGAVTEGDTLEEAITMAEDCLGGVLMVYEDEKRAFPKASELTAFATNTKEEFVSLINVDLTAYKRKNSEKPVKKTLYIPKGLNDKAEELGLNFSKVLREALIKELTLFSRLI
ncbi:MAG: type II toxin-antitoxin system HicB family antitoxin [Firmicutes bacterium]|nr:type II toxin-antitoxin system HicB family antitoxin [Bacillota bacterium]